MGIPLSSKLPYLGRPSSPVSERNMSSAGTASRAALSAWAWACRAFCSARSLASSSFWRRSWASTSGSSSFHRDVTPSPDPRSSRRTPMPGSTSSRTASHAASTAAASPCLAARRTSRRKRESTSSTGPMASSRDSAEAPAPAGPASPPPPPAASNCSPSVESVVRTYSAVVRSTFDAPGSSMNTLVCLTSSRSAARAVGVSKSSSSAARTAALARSEAARRASSRGPTFWGPDSGRSRIVARTLRKNSAKVRSIWMACDMVPSP
mmetsp:Transcript_394/g.1278  ORF Transcript_394/g.1278 Transcript_394/m.1278 type:complete len:265 (+) Transcript_394:635-1429(+)